MNAVAIIISTDAVAPDVTYRDLVPGKRHFECGRIRGLLSTDTCAGRWKEAKTDRESVRVMSCRGCVTGEIHATGVNPLESFQEAGKRAVVSSPDEGRRCTRCGRGGSRIVGGMLCVSCWNREREFVKKRNGRGKPPANFGALADRHVGVMIDGQPGWIRVTDTQNNREPTARTIRQREGASFHNQHPGTAAFNEKAQRWEYRDRDDQANVLLEVEYDGVIEHMSVPASSLGADETPATPRLPTQIHGVHFVAAWLAGLDDDENDVDRPEADWKPTSFICSGCGIAQIQARLFASQVECRCPACSASTVPARPAQRLSLRPAFEGRGFQGWL